MQLGAMINGRRAVYSFVAGKGHTDQYVNFIARSILVVTRLGILDQVPVGLEHRWQDVHGWTFQSAQTVVWLSCVLMFRSYIRGTLAAGSDHAPAAANDVYGLRPTMRATSTNDSHPLAT